MKITLTETYKEALQWFYATYPDVQFVGLWCSDGKYVPRYPIKNRRPKYATLVNFLESDVDHSLGICPHSINFHVLDIDNRECPYSDPEAIQYFSLGKNEGTHYWYPGHKRSAANVRVCDLGHSCGDIKGSANNYVHLRGDNVVVLSDYLARCRTLSCYNNTIDPTPTPDSPPKYQKPKHPAEVIRPYRTLEIEEMVVDVAGTLELGYRDDTLFFLIAEYGYRNSKSIKSGDMPVEQIIEFGQRCYDIIPDKTDLENTTETKARKTYEWVKNVYGLQQGDLSYYDKAAELYEQGYSLREIGEIVNKHFTTVKNALIRQGVYKSKL